MAGSEGAEASAAEGWADVAAAEAWAEEAACMGQNIGLD